MDRRAKVELFEQMRREFEFGIGSVQGVARKFGVHRRMVRQAVASAVPPERKGVTKPAPALDPVKPFIDAILKDDKTAPRKQRHTAHRIWVRLCKELPASPVAESTVRKYVRERKWELGISGKEVHIPQDYDWGVETQVDWYEAWVDLDGERTKLQIFEMRSMKSGGAFHIAYLHATQQAFFAAHEAAFAYFGGVFRVLRYDNLSSAVKKIYRGHTREEHEAFIKFRSHWLFEAEFCNAAQPQEKGGVEGEGGYFRRNHMVPVPVCATLEAFNQKLMADCVEDQSRRIGDRPAQVGEMMVQESEHLLPLAKEGFDLAQTNECIVDAKRCAKSHLAWYSTPLPVGSKVHIRALPSQIEIWHANKKVAVHARSYERGRQVFNIEHYFDVFDKKPGALPGSRPLAQCRAQGLWPVSFDLLWDRWKERLGKHESTRAVVDLLLLAPIYGWPALKEAAQKALDLGCSDENAVRYLLAQPPPSKPIAPLSPEALGELSTYDRPMPEMDIYDRLMAGETSFVTSLAGAV